MSSRAPAAWAPLVVGLGALVLVASTFVLPRPPAPEPASPAPLASSARTATTAGPPARPGPGEGPR